MYDKEFVVLLNITQNATSYIHANTSICERKAGFLPCARAGCENETTLDMSRRQRMDVERRPACITCICGVYESDFLKQDAMHYSSRNKFLNYSTLQILPRLKLALCAQITLSSPVVVVLMSMFIAL
jgi:hypothetical protein